MKDVAFSINYDGSGNFLNITRYGEELEETEDTPDAALDVTIAFGASRGDGNGLAFYWCRPNGWCYFFFNGKLYRYRC